MSKAIVKDKNSKYTKRLNAGENWYCQIGIKDKDDAYINISGKTVNVYIRSGKFGTAIITKTIITHFDQTTYKGKTYFNLEPTETETTLGAGLYYLEVKYTNSTLEVAKEIGWLIIE